MKKVIGMLLITAMTAAMAAGCGTKKEESPQAVGDANGTEESAETEDGKKTGDGSSAQGETFLIGGSGPLTGENASYGNSVKQGAQIAVDEINEAGGVDVGGKKVLLSLKYLDDEAGAQQAVAAYGSLVDDGADAILGTVTSGSCEAIVDLTKEDGLLQVTPSGSSEACTKNDNNFRICFTDPLQGKTMADFAVDTAGYKNIAMIYNVGDTYSSGMAEAFAAEVEAKGAAMVAKESFTTGDVDFNSQLTTIKNAGAEVIFVPAYYQDAAYIVNQAKQQGMDIPFIGGDGWDGILGQVEDASVVEGVVFLSPFLATDETPVVKNFVEKYQKAYDATPDQFAADAYDGVYVIKAAMEKAGTTDSAAIIGAMTEIQVEGTTGNMTFTPEGEPNKEAKLIEIKNGAYTLLK